MIEKAKHLLGEHEHVKHVVDAVTIPSGIIAGVAHWMDLVNGFLTFLVLITSLIWGIYRIIDMHETRVERKNEKDAGTD